MNNRTTMTIASYVCVCRFLESIKWPFEIFMSFLILIFTIRFGVAFGKVFFLDVADAIAAVAVVVVVVVFADTVFQPNSIC